MNFTDAAPVDGLRLTADGYLVADARCVRTGIQIYTGREVGKPEMEIVRVYRPEAEVFSRDSLASFSHIPITDDHPAEPVTSENWKDLAKGETSGEVLRDGERLRIPLIVKDAAAVKKVHGGKRELSAGYTCDLAFESGTAQDGQTYDAVQKNIRANHLAIVDRGRAGSQCRIGDTAAPHNWGAAPLHPTTKQETDTMSDALRTVVVDGLSVQTTDQGAQAIQKLQGEVKDAKDALSNTETKHAEAIKAKDEEIGTLKADKKTLEDKAPKPEDLDRMVADRVSLVTTAKAIVADVKTEGLSDADIRKAVVTAKYGEDFTKDASEGEITGMFKALAKDVKPTDPLRTAIQHQDRRPDTTNDNGQAAYEARLRDAWKPKKEA